MNPVVGRDSRGRGRRGEWGRGLFCCSFLQFFLLGCVHREHNARTEREDSAAFEVKRRTALISAQCPDTILSLIRCI